MARKKKTAVDSSESKRKPRATAAAQIALLREIRDAHRKRSRLVDEIDEWKSRVAAARKRAKLIEREIDELLDGQQALPFSGKVDISKAAGAAASAG